VLATERISRKLHETLPDGDEEHRAAVWAFLRPMLSPRLAELHRDAFVTDEPPLSTVDLTAHRSDSNLEELDLELGDDSEVG
jgi:hypothetical protein